MQAQFKTSFFICYDMISWPYSPVDQFSDTKAWTALPHLLLMVLRKPCMQRYEQAAHAKRENRLVTFLHTTKISQVFNSKISKTLLLLIIMSCHSGLTSQIYEIFFKRKNYDYKYSVEIVMLFYD